MKKEIKIKNEVGELERVNQFVEEIELVAESDGKDLTFVLSD